MRTDKTFHAFYASFFAVAILLTFPLVLLCGYTLKKYWNAQFIIKRRRHLILLQYILFIWHSFIDFPFYVFLFIFAENLTLLSIPGFIFVISFPIRCITASLFGLRIYLLYFDHEYEKILSQKKWQILIDPQIENTNWFLINRKQKFGNPSYLIKYIMTPIICTYFAIYCITLLMTADHNKLMESVHVQAFTASYCVILVIFGIYFWRKFPKIMDGWAIRNEIGLSIKILALFPIALISAEILKFVGIVDFKEALLIMFTSLEICIAGVIFILVPYSATKQSGYNKQTKLLLTPSTSNNWKDTIKTSDGYEQFASFLEREFAVENLMFITEYIQLKKIMTQNETLQTLIQNELKLEYSIMIPESEPISIIATELSEFIATDKTELVIKALKATNKLFTKYINPHTAALEVNINADARQKLMSVFDTRTDDDNTCKVDSVIHILSIVMPLLEDAAQQISWLINGSHIRFAHTSVFAELINQKTTRVRKMTKITL